MLKPHIFGTSAFIGDAGILSSKELLPRIGSNSGNLLFCHSLTRMLNASVEPLAWTADLSHLPRDTSCLVAPLSNQLGTNHDLERMATNFRRSPLPLVGIGLGIQGTIHPVPPESIRKDSWKLLKALIEQAPGDAPNVAVRGPATLSTIAYQGWDDRCVITGCPSNFINPSGILGRHVRRRLASGVQRIAVAAGNPFLIPFRTLEQSLASMVDRNDGLYICQQQDLVKISLQDFHSVSAESFEAHRSTIKPSLDDDQFLAWMRTHSHVFTSVSEWLNVLKRYDLVVGTRIHGVMAGIQAGIPGLCISVDTRTEELCETMSVPYVNALDYPKGISESEVIQILNQFDWETYDQTRMKLAGTLSNFLANNQLRRPRILETIKSEWLEWHKSIQPEPSDSTPEHRQQYSTATRADRYVQLFTTAKKLTGHFEQWNILSYGCSEGFETHDLGTKFFPNAHIVGCDINTAALEVAIRGCVKPSRIKHLFSTPETLKAHGPYDLIFALSVLCRWPKAKGASDLSEIYPFSDFEKTITQLDSVLKPGGVLVIFNANYRFSDTSTSQSYLPVEGDFAIPQPFVEIFSPEGSPLAWDKLDGYFFQKQPA